MMDLVNADQALIPNRVLRRLVGATVAHMQRSQIADPELLAAIHDVVANTSQAAPPEPEWLSAADAASRFGVHPETVYRSAHRGEWRSVRIGRRLLVASSGPEPTRDNTSARVLGVARDDEPDATGDDRAEP